MRLSTPLLGLLLGLLLGCAGVPPEAGHRASEGGPTVFEQADAAGLKAAMDAGGVVVVDVRTPEEYASGHVPGARSLPLGELGDRLTELEPFKDQALHLVCASGGRSARAQRVLSDAGFVRPINVEGGTRAWIAAGLPVE